MVIHKYCLEGHFGVACKGDGDKEGPFPRPRSAPLARSRPAALGQRVPHGGGRRAAERSCHPGTVRHLRRVLLAGQGEEEPRGVSMEAWGSGGWLGRVEERLRELEECGCCHLLRHAGRL